MVKKVFIETRLCNPMTHFLKGMSKSLKNKYMVKFNVSISDNVSISNVSNSSLMYQSH